MRVIQTNNFQKLAGSFDDQPGFLNRNRNPSGLGHTIDSPSEKEIVEKFEPKKRKKRKTPKKRIYQLGIDVPVTEKELHAPMINQ